LSAFESPGGSAAFSFLRVSLLCILAMRRASPQQRKEVDPQIRAVFVVGSSTRATSRRWCARGAARRAAGRVRIERWNSILTRISAGRTPAKRRQDRCGPIRSRPVFAARAGAAR
jgi:hypothetical protein